MYVDGDCHNGLLFEYDIAFFDLFLRKQATTFVKGVFHVHVAVGGQIVEINFLQWAVIWC